LCLDLEEVVASRIEQSVFTVIAPARRLVLYLHILTCVVRHHPLDGIVPPVDPGNARLIVHETLVLTHEFQEILLVQFPVLFDLEDTGDQRVGILAPLERILPSRIALGAATRGRTEGVVIIERQEVELIFVPVCRVEVNIVIIAVIPVIIPHPDCNIDCVGLEEKRHIADRREPLREEVEFANLYMDLMKVRFPEGLEMELDIPEELMGASIVPCSIQLLIENATKHNAINKARPLVIRIEAKDGSHIVVSNNLCPKLTQSNSTGKGLKYIRQQFMDISGQDIEICQTENEYSVTLPLL